VIAETIYVVVLFFRNFFCEIPSARLISSIFNTTKTELRRIGKLGENLGEGRHFD
jgi:hypothetical protein